MINHLLLTNTTIQYFLQYSSYIFFNIIDKQLKIKIILGIIIFKAKNNNMVYQKQNIKY